VLASERLEAILEYINQRHSATVAELSDKFCIGETSIRRDLSKLERAGYIRKTYGGAVLLPASNDVLALEARRRIEEAEKTAIARKAASLIKDGDVVFLDSSTTSLAMIPFLKAFNNLSAVTHGIQTAFALLPFPHIKTYLAGGFIKPNLQSCNGVFTCGMFGSMYADKAFISPRAVHRVYGAYCSNEEEMQVRRTMMEHSAAAILLCSTNKLDQSAQFHLCELKKISAVVCEKDPGKEWREILSKNRIEQI
jgi:DeoR/GlpR family transcriptional regulator of sugar metabolism